MATPWTITFDCSSAPVMAAFWKEVLGYVDAPPPRGWDTWEDWLRHFEVQVGGGRDQPWDERERRISAKVKQLVDAGGTVLQEYRERDGLDHVVMADPEGNELCVV
jgi:hypothetical protein